MKPLSDAAVARLLDTVDRPDAGDRYEVHELLGRGGMGAVYRATDRVLQRDVALKVLTTALDGEESTRRLEREARLLASLEHPGIIAIHDAGLLGDGRPFYVMRLVRGERLDDHARLRGRGERLRLFLSVCDAVAFAHSRGVIHRDLKPANVMIGEFGEVLVLDWGIAKVGRLADSPSKAPLMSEGVTGAGVTVGTPGFMAPEQLVPQGPIDARTDVFGLGAMLRQLLGDVDVPAALRAIVTRATATDPGLRYQSVDALAADVRAWLDGLSVTAYAERPWERVARLYRRNSALVLLLVTYLLVRMFILWWRGV